VPRGIINIEDLAQLEFDAGKLPIVILRRNPNGRGQKIPVSQLINIAQPV
jgi:hypothetical protein